MRRLLIVVTGMFAVGAAMTLRGAGAWERATPTFAKDVAPIVFNKCASCHRPGEAVPMSLTSYKEVRPWSKAIREQVIEHTMPPWYADPETSLRFRNDRRLSQHDIDTIVAWVDGGSPKGDDQDLPPLPRYVPGWSLGEPDMIIPMPIEFEVPAEGELPLQNFYVPVPFKEDRWVEAVELRPGNPAVVHHSIANVTRLPEGTQIIDGRAVRIEAPKTATATDSGQTDGRRGRTEVFQSQDSFTRAGAFKLVGQAPGKGFERHRPGIAKKISPGMYFQFNMHYQPSGRPEKDRSMLGLWFSKVPVNHEVLTKGVIETLIVGGKELGEIKIINGREVKTRGRIPNIPPNTDNWEIIGQLPIKDDITIYAFAPHMHLRGKDIKYIMIWPDGRQTTLLYVPRYDFNWQLHYELEEPLKVPAGSKMVAIAHYDNSIKNRYNPAPQKEVFWSEQSWDEMFIPWFEYTVDRMDLTKLTAAETANNK
jgi:Copper type II ascorbate-dependent monooxygenase, C-terminal domain